MQTNDWFKQAQQTRTPPTTPSTGHPSPQIAPPVKSSILDFLQNLEQLRKTLGPQIKFVNKIIPYEQQLKQLAMQSVKINASTRRAIETRFEQINKMIKTLLSAGAKNTNQIATLEQYLIGALQKSFPQIGQPAPQVPATPAAAPTPPSSPASAIGKGVGSVMKAPGRAWNKLKDWAGQQASQFGQGYSSAESNQRIVTAEMGSASSIINYQN